MWVSGDAGRAAAADATLAGDRLAEQAFVLLPGPFVTATAARSAVWAACRRAHRLLMPEPDWPALDVVGNFVIPPHDEGKARDFQALHFDFGLPLDPRGPGDVAVYTALHICADRGAVDAQTRLVRLGELLGQRRWPTRADLIRRFRRYGASHGAWDPRLGYSEGIFARLVEAAGGRQPALPSVSATPDFLCGTEFASIDDEQSFLERHGLRLAEVETSVDLRPGQLLLFDNLACAHGRRGRRQPGELRQWIFGYRQAPASQQRRLREKVLRAFDQ